MIRYRVDVYKNGRREWYVNDKLSREDGPAIEGVNGEEYWYLNGEELSEHALKKLIKKKYAPIAFGIGDHPDFKYEN
jgi:hypothetical protein